MFFLRKTEKKPSVNMFVKCCKITSDASGGGARLSALTPHGFIIPSPLRA